MAAVMEKKKMKRTLFLFSFVSFILANSSFLTGCGQSGSLYLPQPEQSGDTQ
jgi:predicted small lipoprotein YifL